VPTIALDGGGDGVMPLGGIRAARPVLCREVRTTGKVPVVGHDLPQEAPSQFADAVLAVI